MGGCVQAKGGFGARDGSTGRIAEIEITEMKRSSLQFARGVDAELLFLEAEWSGR
jgi:hypothetical protein